MNSKALIFILKYLLLLIRKISIRILTGRDKIVIISLHKIGDTVFTISAINYLYKLYHNNLVLICYPNSQSIYKSVQNDLNIKVLSQEKFLYKRFALPSARKIIKKLKPKIIYDLTGTITSLSLISVIKVEGLYGICDPIFKNAYTKSLIKRKNPPLTDLFLDAVKYFSNTNESFILTEKQNTSFEDSLILIHPFAGWKAKEWNLNKFILLTEMLSKEYECAIISEYGSINYEIREYLLNKNIIVLEPKDIDELIIQISKCKLFIGNDSGPLYIAALLGKATFTIYGPTNPEYSLPVGEQHSHIIKRLKCSPEKNHQYCFTNAGREGCPSFECMNLLDVSEVFEKIKYFIGKQFLTNTGQSIGIKDPINSNI